MEKSFEKYQPTKKEMETAHNMMTEKEKKMSKKREKSIEENWTVRGYQAEFQATQSAGNTFYYRDAALAFEKAGDQDRARKNWEKFTEDGSNIIYNECQDVALGFERLGDKSKADLYKKIIELIDKSEMEKNKKEE